MLKTCVLAAAALALGVAPALAQSSSQSSHSSKSSKPSSSASSQAPSASQAGSPAAADVGPVTPVIVVDPDAQTAMVVPANPRAGVPPEVTAVLKTLTSTGQVKPGQVVNIVVRRGGQVTQVIANAPIP